MKYELNGLHSLQWNLVVGSMWSNRSKHGFSSLSTSLLISPNCATKASHSYIRSAKPFFVGCGVISPSGWKNRLMLMARKSLLSETKTPPPMWILHMTFGSLFRSLSTFDLIVSMAKRRTMNRVGVRAILTFVGYDPLFPSCWYCLKCICSFPLNLFTTT